MANETRVLRVALKANAVFSGLCGLALMIAPQSWAELIGLPWPWVFGALGIGLACFAVLACYAVAQVLARRAIITGIIGADVLWVAASPIAMLTGAGTLTVPGQGLIAFVAVIVAALAAAQWIGLQAATRHSVARSR